MIVRKYRERKSAAECFFTKSKNKKGLMEKSRSELAKRSGTKVGPRKKKVLPFGGPKRWAQWEIAWDLG